VKRDEALISLSRDHHKALAIALRLRRATPETQRDVRAAFLTFWDEHGCHHFELEEDVLVPAYAPHGDAEHPLVLRMLEEHDAIRRDAAHLADEADPALDALHALGERLSAHVRMEERELFPVIEAAMPVDALAAVADALDRAH
jgi:hemerythrin-like domain-containing protein